MFVHSQKATGRGRDGARSPFGRWVRTAAFLASAAVVASSAVALGTIATAPPAQAAPAEAQTVPGQPGVPQDPTTLYSEDFENSVGAEPVVLSDYTGADGHTYTADDAWLTNCNGNIVEFVTTDLGNCERDVSAAHTRQLAYALGAFRGSASPETNHAVTAYTEGDPGADKVEFATVNPIDLPSATGRFVTFSVDAAADNCAIAAAPLYQFSLTGGAASAPVGGQINACTSTTSIDVPASDPIGARPIKVGTYTSDGSVLFTGSSLGLQMVNAEGSGEGNDAAFDNIRILDATPQLDKSFSPATVQPGQSSTLTLTVTNTSELAAKDGWAFTDTLPEGLTVAPEPNAGGTCTATTTATAGSNEIAVTGGSLAAGEESCTITVDVTAGSVGSYTNDADNITTLTGLNPPGSTTLDVTAPVVSCTTDPNVFNTGYDAATGGVLAAGAVDSRWTVAGGFAGFDYPNGTTPPDATSMPPADAVFTPAQVGKVSAVWADSPYSNAQWVSADYRGVDTENQKGPEDPGDPNGAANGDWFYQYQFALDSAVDPSTFALHINFLADNSVAGVYVNGQPQTGTNLPQDTADPYNYVGFTAANASQVVLDQDWQPGLNTIIVQIKSYYGGEGFDAQVQPVALCPADFGDAPDSYGTTNASGGARHFIPGYDKIAHTSPVMLGEHIDAEGNGLASAMADEDDTKGVDDEDGVRFNPALGYSTPTLLTGLDAGTHQAVENTLSVDASAPGFVSVWVDWNEDGDFADDGEQVVAAQAVAAGDNDLTFSQGDNPPGIHTFVRVRYSTDAAAIASPTGTAPDGEVEDYRVQVQRMIVPSSCTVSDATHYAFTFGPVTDASGDGGPGTTARFPDVSVIDGVPVDMVVDVVAGSTNRIDHGSGGTFGVDDANWQIDRQATLRYSFYRAGTTTPVGVSAVFTVNDMDGSEVATFDSGDVASYAVTQGSRVTIDQSGGTTTFSGHGDNNGDPPSRFQVTLEGVSTMEVDWQGFPNSGFGFDGDGDLTIQPACSDFGDAPDSYGTTSANDGASHVITPGLTLGSEIDFDPDGQPTAGADGDDTNRVADEDGVTTPILVTTGTPTSVAVSATNTTDQPATLAGWIDLDGSGTFDARELASVAVPANSGTADYELTFPAGTTTDDTYARFRLFAGSVDSPEPTGAVTGGEVEDYPVTVQDRQLSIEKTSDATADSRIGDTVHYTVTAENTGTGDYTADDPAVVTDSLTGVLDDASYAGDATATIDGDDAGPVTRTGDRLAWSGALASGDTVTIGYSVVLKAGGDGDVRNVAWGGTPPNGQTPTCDPRNADGTDPATGVPCGLVDFGIPTLTIDKKASATELPADGGTVTYTVTVTNDSDTDFTANAPATASDDLSNVLDDADYNGDVDATVGTATFDEDAQELDWSGALQAHAQAVITYSVTYDSGKGGDRVLTNQACVPVDLAADPDDDCRSVDIPGAALRVSKSVDPADGTAVRSGQDVTYTLTFESTGETAAAADTTDDLSGVLDDATITSGPTASDPALTPSVNDGQLHVSGSVPADETYTVQYTVTVNAFADQGDHDLANVLAGCADDDQSCRTDNPVAHLTVDKTAEPSSGVDTGDTVDYTVTVTNDGAGDYTAGDPAVVTDDLTGVLDDATVDESSVTASSGQTSYSAPILTWTGALAAGKKATITYTVTVTDLGDHSLVNTAGPVCTDPEICDPPVTVTVPLPHVTALKTSDPADGSDVQVGDEVTYTLTYVNDGEAAGAVDSTDDLSNVLDDADVTGEPVSSAPDDVTALRDGDSIRVAGDIDPGQTVTVVYTVTVKPNGQHGDNDLGNVLTQDTPQLCDDGNPCPPQKTEHPVGDLVDGKTVDPASGSTVRPGTVLTYTLHFENTGNAPVSVDRDDDLTGVLDDATVTSVPESSDPALRVSPIADGRFSVTGDLDAGATVTVTYQVTVNPDGQRGDDQLGNFLLDPGQDPPAECVPTDDQMPDCTVNYVSNVVVVKTADPASGTAVTSGQKVTYTLEFTNVSTNPKAADATIDETDYLKDVLDDATLTAGPSTDPALTAAVSGNTIVVTGSLASGQTAKVAYTVTVKAYDAQGDHALGNVVARTGDEPICAPGSSLCTHHDITPPPPGLADTGSDLSGLWALIVVLLAAGGGAVIVSRRRRPQTRW